MKIPKKFYLYGLPVQIVIDNSLDSMGQAFPQEYRIKISRKKCKTRASLEQTYCHELLHMVLLNSNIVNKYKLENGKELWLDEDFIDNVSTLLHQALTMTSGNITAKDFKLNKKNYGKRTKRSK